MYIYIKRGKLISRVYFLDGKSGGSVFTFADQSLSGETIKEKERV